jgi:hypothetical protein
MGCQSHTNVAEAALIHGKAASLHPSSKRVFDHFGTENDVSFTIVGDIGRGKFFLFPLEGFPFAKYDSTTPGGTSLNNKVYKINGIEVTLLDHTPTGGSATIVGTSSLSSHAGGEQYVRHFHPFTAEEKDEGFFGMTITKVQNEGEKIKSTLRTTSMSLNLATQMMENPGLQNAASASINRATRSGGCEFGSSTMIPTWSFLVAHALWDTLELMSINEKAIGGMPHTKHQAQEALKIPTDPLESIGDDTEGVDADTKAFLTNYRAVSKNAKFGASHVDQYQIDHPKKSDGTAANWPEWWTTNKPKLIAKGLAQQKHKLISLIPKDISEDLQAELLTYLESVDFSKFHGSGYYQQPAQECARLRAVVRRLGLALAGEPFGTEPIMSTFPVFDGETGETTTGGTFVQLAQNPTLKFRSHSASKLKPGK